MMVSASMETNKEKNHLLVTLCLSSIAIQTPLAHSWFAHFRCGSVVIFVLGPTPQAGINGGNMQPCARGSWGPGPQHLRTPTSCGSTGLFSPTVKRLILQQAR